MRFRIAGIWRTLLILVFQTFPRFACMSLTEACPRLVGASQLTRERRKQANAGDFIYIFYGTLDHPEDLPPKGEFFCKKRDSWMPEIPGMTHYLYLLVNCRMHPEDKFPLTIW